MRRTYGKLQSVLIALLSLALVFGVVFATAAFAEPVGDNTSAAATGLSVQITLTGEGFDTAPYTKTYDKAAFTLTAQATKDGNSVEDITYKWYFKASGSDEATLQENETSATYTVENGTVDKSGTYYCEVTSSTDGTAKSNEIEITINKKEFTLEDPWESDEVQLYTGNEITVDLTAEAKSKLNKEFGESGWKLIGNKYTDAGDYTAEVSIEINAESYENRIPKLNWNISKTAPVNPKGERGHVFEAKDANGNPLSIEGTTVKVKDVNGAVDKSYTLTGGAATYGIGYFANALKDNGKNDNASILRLLDLHFVDGENKEVAVSGSFEVTLTDTEKFGSLSQDDLIVFHIYQSAAGETTSLVAATVKDGAITFTVENFSAFAVLSNSSVNDVSTWWIWVLLAIIIILNIVIILLLLLRGKEDDKAQEPEPETTAATEAENTEETQPVEETLPDEEEIPFVLPVVEGEAVVLDRSFAARLSQADDSVKDLYTAITNELHSYKKIRSRISWKFESFYKGRHKCVILQLRGKKINMYIALNAAELAPKYHAKDVSDRARYKSVPTLVKIGGKRSLLYAKQLVALLMTNLGVERGTAPTATTRIRRKATKTLIDEGLIKIKTAKNSFIHPAEEQTAPDEDVAATTEQAANNTTATEATADETETAPAISTEEVADEQRTENAEEQETEETDTSTETEDSPEEEAPEEDKPEEENPEDKPDDGENN